MNTLTNLINENFTTPIAVLTALDTALKASPNDLSIKAFRDSQYKKIVGKASHDVTIFASVLANELELSTPAYLSKFSDEQEAVKSSVRVYVEMALDTILEGGC